ncbi:TIGR02444 family protein [Shewanella avicenniae]|uniref:TIGR02444 family protein n=1 Tax=Shewanella avicenniae TaxID=2814294 RepID=A0ABX7QU43_9GAMM|nr:TIGR02444 family protein [Shewanella avicenniae]QSX34363.1 TIGR02444 family protein [Shewanella avicenniae]
MVEQRVFDSSLWQDGDQLYHSLQSTCIALQDEYGLAVNLLLLAMTLDQRTIALGEDCWERLQLEFNSWQQKFLAPFRKLRCLSKSQLQEQEYRRMLDVELMLERNGQRLILNKLNQNYAAQPYQAPHWNLNCYLSMFNLSIEQFPELTAAA